MKRPARTSWTRPAKKLESQIEKAKEEIVRERDLAMADLREQVADLSLMISEKVIGATLDEQGQRQLIAEFLDQTEELK